MASNNHVRQVGGFGGGKLRNLPREPAVGIGSRLGVMMQTQNQRADFFIAPAAVISDQPLNGDGQFILSGVAVLHCFVESLAGQKPRFSFVKHRHPRVEAQFVTMTAHELETKTVQRADVRGVEKRELFGVTEITGIFLQYIFQRGAKILAQFGGGGFGEGDDEQFIQRRAVAFEAVQTAGNERGGFASSGTSHNEHVATRFDRLSLCACQGVIFFGWYSHVTATD